VKRLLVGIAVILVVVSMSGMVRADAPVVTITSPTDGSTLYFPSFPATVNLGFTISHNDLSDLNVLDIKVDNTSIFSGGPLGNPFPSNACSSAQMVLPNISSCSTNGSNLATVSAPCVVSQIGTYAIAVSVKHRGAEGVDEEDVTIALLVVEYPAPPAVANAYLNNGTFNKKTLTGSVRGCIISQIANNHAMESKYGPKGGPYDESLIKADTDILYSICLVQ
jgi:hypothetical protein